MKKYLTLLLLLISTNAFATPPQRVITYVPDTTIRSQDVTDNEDEILQYLQTGVTKVNVDCSQGVLKTDSSGVIECTQASGQGDITSVGDCTTGGCFVDNTNNTLIFDGATDDDYEVTVTSNDPTSDISLIIPVDKGSGYFGVTSGSFTPGNFLKVGTNGEIVDSTITAFSNGGGTVVGPAVSTTNGVSIYCDAGGTNICDSGVTISSGALTASSVVMTGVGASILDSGLTINNLAGGASNDNFLVKSDTSNMINVSAASNLLTAGGTWDFSSATTTGITGVVSFINSSTATFGNILVGDGTGFNSVAMAGDTTINSNGTVAIGADKVTEAMLKAVNGATDEYCLTYETTTGDFEWQSCASGGGTNWEITLLPQGAVLDDTSPPALTIVESTGTGTPRRWVADFDPTTDEILYWTFVTPSYLAAGNWTLDVEWYSNDTGANEDAIWAAQISCTTAGDVDSMAEDAAGSANTGSSNVSTTEANRLIDTTITLSNTDSVATGDVCTLTFFRDADDTVGDADNDGLTSDARLIAVKVQRN